MARRLCEIYAPKPQAEKDFVAKHGLKKTTDKSPATKDGKLFNATNIKTFDRTAKRMGYKPGADEKAYDNGRTTAPNDQEKVSAIAPYTVKMGEEAEIDEATFKDVPHKGKFTFSGEKEYPFSGIAKGPWVKTGPRSYRHHDEEHHQKRYGKEDIKVGSIKAKTNESLDEANLINKKKKNEYIKKIGKEKSPRPNPTDCKKAGRAALRKEDIEITDDNIDLLIDLIDDFLLKDEA